MLITPAARFCEALEAMGIPIDGCGEGPDCRIDFQNHATPQQRETALALRATFDWTPRRLKDPSTIDLSKLTTDQRQLVNALMMKEFLVAHPKLAKALGVVVEE